MRLYLTLEEGDNKVERAMFINEDSASDHIRSGIVVESMYEELSKILADQEMVDEARSITQHND